MAIDWKSKRYPQWFEHNIPEKNKFPRRSTEDLIRWCTDVEEVRDLMSLRAYYQAMDLREKELDELWVSDPIRAAKASYGANWGYYYGKSEIRRWYVDEFKAKRDEQLRIYCEKMGLPVDEKYRGSGCMVMLPMSTSLVHIAADGKSAKGVWYVIGQQTDLQADGSARGWWEYDKLCADFVKEDGKFKIYHIVCANDQNYQAGTRYDAPNYIAPEDDALAVAFGKPTISMNVHDNTYNWADNYPPIPAPYDTLTP